MHEVLVNRLGGLSLPRKSVVRLSVRPDMTIDIYRGCKTTIQQQQQNNHVIATENYNAIHKLEARLIFAHADSSDATLKLILFSIIH